MIGKSRPSISTDDLYNRISGEELLRRYVGVEYVPSLIHSPLREDEHRSFSLFYAQDNKTVLFKDHASGMAGDVVYLLALLWDCSREDVIYRVWDECDCTSRDIVPVQPKIMEPAEIQIKVRKAEKRDIDYWQRYGISKDWLRFAGIVPISHFVLVYGGRCLIYKADELAYAYTSPHGIKLYQPHSNIKWRSSQKKNYVQLYDKLPDHGHMVCVCSSMKDALCLWAQTGIPSIAPQSEGVSLPPAIVNDLKERFHRCCILYDNDEAGLGYAREAAKETGFENIVLPKFDGGKDVSDLYKLTDDKTEFKHNMILLFEKPTKELLTDCKDTELPF